MTVGMKDRMKDLEEKCTFHAKYPSMLESFGGAIARSADFASERERMVQRLVSEGLLRSPEVIAALRKVPRELFVSNELRAYAYNDTPLPTDRGQTISAPHGK